MSDTDLFDLMDDWGPEKIVCVSDRRTGMRGVLVIDNTARGMGKGGTRMSATLTVGEVARLARTMTWKWAAVDLFYGGAKAGILGDPRRADKEAVLRAFARALADEVPAEYVFGLDMGLAEADAAIFVDELRSRGVATGLPRALGGTPYDQLGITGYGVAEAAQAVAADIDLPLVGARVVIQGFGAVGAAAAARLSELGARVVGVSNALGTLADPDGLDVAALTADRVVAGDEALRAAAGAGGLQHVDAALDLDCDILVPAARQDVIDADVAARTSARLVVEGANLPTSDDARRILHDRGVAVVPDFIANAGGIIAAAYSMDARTSAFVVDTAEVFATVSEKLRANAVEVLARSRRTGATTRQAALDMAQARVLAAMELRGQCPAAAVSRVGAA
ncbi:Glu/Leu/Phe/Val family dehydrogenase [Mobilicoccus caccae]|uniref:Glu/Leu/Phe/Val family dehydrogenase n=1 Tax=Mobilicoccus caccae TaxID=1859295 RepID=UPI0024E0FD03|nr:Glu/Leu/Phe/Val dehydrogenase dimerization domain-containing protein [Mobilicoccus caccae]